MPYFENYALNVPDYCGASRVDRNGGGGELGETKLLSVKLWSCTILFCGTCGHDELMLTFELLE